MPIDLNINLNINAGDKYDTILSLLQQLMNKEEYMSQELDDLKNEVQRSQDVEQGAVTLIQGIADKLAAVANDPAQVRQLSQQLHSSTDALAQAILANTPDQGGGTTGGTDTGTTGGVTGGTDTTGVTGGTDTGVTGGTDTTGVTGGTDTTGGGDGGTPAVGGGTVDTGAGPAATDPNAARRR